MTPKEVFDMEKMFRWKKGNGEIIGFAVSVLLIVFLIVTVVSYTGLTTRKQQLAVAAYAAGRAAAVSPDPDLANKRAAAVLKGVYTEDHYVTSSSTTPGDVWYEISYKGNWEIGNIFTITVTHHSPALFPFPERDHAYKYAMMIESQMPNYK